MPGSTSASTPIASEPAPPGRAEPAGTADVLGEDAPPEVHLRRQLDEHNPDPDAD